MLSFHRSVLHEVQSLRFHRTLVASEEKTEAEACTGFFSKSSESCELLVSVQRACREVRREVIIIYREREQNES